MDVEFNQFLLAVYPDPPHPESDQYGQLRDAFMAGALIARSCGKEVNAELIEYGRKAMGNQVARNMPIKRQG